MTAKDVLKSVTEKTGEQFVMMDLTLLMLLSSADS